MRTLLTCCLILLMVLAPAGALTASGAESPAEAQPHVSEPTPKAETVAPPSEPHAPAATSGAGHGVAATPAPEESPAPAEPAQPADGGGEQTIPDSAAPLDGGVLSSTPAPDFVEGADDEPGTSGDERADGTGQSLRVRSSIKPGSVVRVGDQTELTAVPVGFDGVNYKIQWQVASVDENGDVGPFENITGATGAKLTIVFDEENIGYQWRAVIRIVD